MKKYVPIILVLIVVTLTAYILLNERATRQYDDGEISFNYPESWAIEYGSNPSQVVLFKPTPDSNITINKQVIPPGYQSPENYKLNTNDTYSSGLRLDSHVVKDINTDTAYENTYTANTTDDNYLRKEVWIPKNGNLYSIIYTRSPYSNSTEDRNGFNLQFMEEFTVNRGFETITGNFKVQSVLVAAETPFWGDISIPKLNVDWGIRRDTVNGYDSVFHYGESSYPNQNGTMGILGHHTSYSAPFRDIDELHPGDEVVINDYLSQKKYIYQVVSNGDIKRDYKTNLITFPPGSDNLTLVTCYPPGTTEFAWLVHCKLISIEPL